MRDLRRFFLAGLAYLLPTFPLGYLWHLNWFHARYEQLQMYRAEVIIPLGLGSMLILIFSFKFKQWGLPYLPPGSAVAARDYAVPLLGVVDAGSWFDRGLRLIMPTITLSLLQMAAWSRFTRASMLEVLRQDYVRTARAKGLLEQLVIAKHALRNALIPLITIVTLALPGLYGGAIITETIFNYQGMGLLFIDSLFQSDWPVALAYLMVLSVLTVAANVLADVVYTVVDPRIRMT